ncbi:endothelin-converting enzyme-like 1 [Plakobranchus ocellatus]|uniref:Endothelin-converting enzyme-like 1 n=1 Tax=Plakobranchus ocellatus TaxID=259542 RepID=A0AAV4CPH3_9GAST|nr:endothelin-converting enzyme-like 1 [Plakobranchus ocellatus]
MNVMVDNLMTAFYELLEDATWMGDETKAEAHEKLAAMGRKIGYPDYGFSDEEIEEKYKSLVMTPDNLYENLDILFRKKSKKPLNNTIESMNKTTWPKPTFLVNAFYLPRKNYIVFPAGILQPPVFSESFPDSINYGAIGTIIGHEITHGFDTKGERLGALQSTFYFIVLNFFHLRILCFKINGITTQQENVADNGGLKEGYRAYKKMTTGKEDAKFLPGLNLTHDQLFFLAFAQRACWKATKANAIAHVLSSKHAPN